MRVKEARGETARRGTKQTPAPIGLPHESRLSDPCVCEQPENQTFDHGGGGSTPAGYPRSPVFLTTADKIPNRFNATIRQASANQCADALRATFAA